MQPPAPDFSARALLTELLAYALASGIALVVDTSLLWVLVNVAGWHYLAASIPAFAAGATVAYLLCIRFVFRFRRVALRQLEFTYFVGLGLAGLLVNAVALSVAITAIGLGLLTAKMLAAGCTFAANFTLRRGLLFARPGAR
jgi:putative flippase GtrA